MKYAIVVPFNNSESFEGEEDTLDQAKLFALKIAEEQGTSCIVENYKGLDEKWILECYKGKFNNI